MFFLCCFGEQPRVIFTVLLPKVNNLLQTDGGGWAVTVICRLSLWGEGGGGGWALYVCGDGPGATTGHVLIANTIFGSVPYIPLLALKALGQHWQPLNAFLFGPHEAVQERKVPL